MLFIRCRVIRVFSEFLNIFHLAKAGRDCLTENKTTPLACRRWRRFPYDFFLLIMRSGNTEAVIRSAGSTSNPSAMS